MHSFDDSVSECLRVQIVFMFMNVCEVVCKFSNCECMRSVERVCHLSHVICDLSLMTMYLILRPSRPLECV